jgi:hypothetical protein
MYKSNLSFKQLDMYLKFLLRQSLVEEHVDLEDGSKTYFVTNKGLQFLSLFENLQGFMGMRFTEDEIGSISKFIATPETEPIAIPQTIRN